MIERQKVSAEPGLSDRMTEAESRIMSEPPAEMPLGEMTRSESGVMDEPPGQMLSRVTGTEMSSALAASLERIELPGLWRLTLSRGSR
jgi:hypothetical protein